VELSEPPPARWRYRFGPVPRNGTRGAGRSVYFRDPDGSLLEFISYG
jgi:catechol 2,3-dioxygenase-like lactoylglutathione lyase family enzyme